MNEPNTIDKSKYHSRQIISNGRKPWRWVILLLFLLTLLLCFIIKITHEPPRPANLTTDTKSTSFKNTGEKLDFLAKYLTIPSGVNDISYHIVYQDNTKGTVPGPSDWDIRAVFMVEKGDLSLWTEGMKKILPEQVDFEWWEDLKTPDFTWEIPEDAEYYKRPGSQSYIVVSPDSGLIFKMVSTTALPLLPEESDLLEELSGYDQFKSLAADELGYDSSSVPYIRTMLADETYTVDGTKLTLICYRALFCNSPLYGIPVLVISGNGNTFCTVLSDGSYADDWSLADIDGDGNDELLIQHLIGITGGAGAYKTGIYRLSDDGISKIFGNPDDETDRYFDTLFTLHLSEGYTYSVGNASTGFWTSFLREDPDGNPYFDDDGNLTDEAREYNEAELLDADPYYYLFPPVDVDGDGSYEIMTAQYTYLYGHADGLGTAYTLLKWDSSLEEFYISDAGFWPYEEYDEDSEEYADYLERWEEYEKTWYKTEKPDPCASLDPDTLIQTVSERIRAIDFHVREYPVNEALYDSETDKLYREAFYKAVTNQKPILCRSYRSRDYEETMYREETRCSDLSDEEFIRQELKQSTRYYYMDYDGDGFPELIIRNTGLYGLKYNPEQDQVTIFLNTYSSYGYLMGAGQQYWHNPCIASKEMYSYYSEDRNGNQVYAGFMTVYHSTDDGSYKSYHVSVDDFRDIEVEKALYEELFSLLETAREDTPASVSFEEFFDGFYEE